MLNRLKYILFCLPILLISCNFKKPVLIIDGTTMGTQYLVKIFSYDNIKKKDLKIKIDSLLFDINKTMSTYMENSEISKFNKRKTTEPIQVSKSFWKIISKSIEISKLTNGLFDITVMPLVNAWGFGPNNNEVRPNVEMIKELKTIVGYNNILIEEKSINNNYQVRKLNSKTQIDFSAIAKGYAVDQISTFLYNIGYVNHLIDIGGEIKVSGRKNKKKWDIGITHPIEINKNIVNVSLDNMSIATSGIYFNFISLDSVNYSHIIDPNTGYPINNNVISVTVISKDCSFADGLATGLMLADINESIKIVNDIHSTEVMILELNEKNTINTYFSNNFKGYVKN